MVLLIQSNDMDVALIEKAITLTFGSRKTHKVPDGVPQPPDNWSIPFKAMAEECQIDTDINSAVVMLTTFINSIRKPLPIRGEK
jgi:hypothetical protein